MSIQKTSGNMFQRTESTEEMKVK